MLTQTSKNEKRRHVHDRIRKKSGHGRAAAAECVSLAEPYLCAADRRPQGRRRWFRPAPPEGKKGERRTGGNLAAAKEVGKAIAERAKDKGIKKVVFDRGGYMYHGRVKALADAAREAGLKF